MSKAIFTFSPTVTIHPGKILKGRSGSAQVQVLNDGKFTIKFATAKKVRHYEASAIEDLPAEVEDTGKLSFTFTLNPENMHVTFAFPTIKDVKEFRDHLAKFESAKSKLKKLTSSQDKKADVSSALFAGFKPTLPLSASALGAAVNGQHGPTSPTYTLSKPVDVVSRVASPPLFAASSDESCESSGEDEDSSAPANVVVLVCEDGMRISDHAFLAAHSPYFKNLCYAKNVYGNVLISLKDCRREDVAAALSLLKGRSNSKHRFINSDNVERMLELAKSYQFPLIKTLCEHFILENWKYDAQRLVQAVKLSGKFGLKGARERLLTPLSANSPSLLTDSNVEQIWEIAAEYNVAALKKKCGKYVFDHWKYPGSKVVRAIELFAKYGETAAVAKLLKFEGLSAASLSMADIEKLFALGDQHPLLGISAACEKFVKEKWLTQGAYDANGLRIVELAYKRKFPDLAKAFIPLAAQRSLSEIDAALPNLPLNLYAAILHEFCRRQQSSGSSFSAASFCGGCMKYRDICSGPDACKCTSGRSEDQMVEKIVKHV